MISFKILIYIYIGMDIFAPIFCGCNVATLNLGSSRFFGRFGDGLMSALCQLDVPKGS